MKRNLKRLALVLAVLVLGLGTALFLWPRDRITAESWKKIQIGMTVKEVENILGGSGITWEEVRAQLRLEKKMGKSPILETQLSEPKEIAQDDDVPVSEKGKYWRGRRGVIEIHFDQVGNVKVKFFMRSGKPPNIIDRLRDWLGW
jgi:hypothetical protein